MVHPATKDDTVLYTLRNFFGDKDITIRMLDGSILDIWGPVFVNGNSIADATLLPIATKEEAEAGVDNTKVMTPLRVKEAVTFQAVNVEGDEMMGKLYINASGIPLALEVNGNSTLGGDVNLIGNVFQGMSAISQLGEVNVQGEASFSGAVFLDHDPDTALEAATKQYVDANIGGGTSDYEVFMKYYISSITSPIPNDGQIRFNEAIQTDATILWFSDRTTGNVEVGRFLGNLTKGNKILIQDKNDANNWQLYTLTSGPIYYTEDSYIEFAVTWNDGGAAIPTGDAIVAVITTSDTSEFLTEADADDLYVNVDGDTMIGPLSTEAPLIVKGNAGSSNHATIELHDEIEGLYATISALSSSRLLINAHYDAIDIYAYDATVFRFSDLLNTSYNPIVLPADPTQPLEAATKQYVDDKVETKSSKYKSITTVAGSSPTAVLTEADSYIRFTASNPTYTIPPNSSVAFPIGTIIEGVGTATAMTIAPGSGVTINKARTLVTVGADSGWSLIKVAADEWDAHGDFV